MYVPETEMHPFIAFFVHNRYDTLRTGVLYVCMNMNMSTQNQRKGSYFHGLSGTSDSAPLILVVGWRGSVGTACTRWQ